MRIAGLILICVLMGLFAIMAFIDDVTTKQELKKQKKQEKENAKINEETIENINVIAGGDIHAGNNILHNLAEKRK